MSLPTPILPIQSLRAIAALMVVWHHATAQVPGLHALFPSRFGAFGVDLFFVISGFIIAATTHGREVTPVAFLRRRLERIAPLYWALTLAMVALALVPPHLFATLSPTPRTVAQSLLFIPHFSDTRPNEIWPLLVPGWTLNFEMFFYALFALLLAAGRRWTVPLLAAACTTLVALGLVVDLSGPIARTYTDPRLLEFAIGAVIGEWHARGGRVSRGPLAWAMLVAGAALLVWGGPAPLAAVGPPLGAVLMVVACLHTGWQTRKQGLLPALGDASYAIYLTHVFTLAALGLAWRRLVGAEASLPSGALFMAGALVACAAVGWLTHIGIERPLLLWLRTRRTTRSQRATAKRAALPLR